MRIEELIEKLKGKPKEYKSLIVEVYKELKSDLRQTLIFLYGIALFDRLRHLESLLEEVRELLIGGNNMDEETKKFLKEYWLLLLYAIVSFTIAIIFGFLP